jgi:hypothetical protein
MKCSRHPGRPISRQRISISTPGAPTYGTIVIAKDGSIRDRSFVNLDMNNFAPRLG